MMILFAFTIERAGKLIQKTFGWIDFLMGLVGQVLLAWGHGGMNPLFLL
jgi:hypothetical protein